MIGAIGNELPRSLPSRVLFERVRITHVVMRHVCGRRRTFSVVFSPWVVAPSLSRSCLRTDSPDVRVYSRSVELTERSLWARVWAVAAPCADRRGPPAGGAQPSGDRTCRSRSTLARSNEAARCDRCTLRLSVFCVLGASLRCR